MVVDIEQLGHARLPNNGTHLANHEQMSEDIQVKQGNTWK
jgi:hypothetical protein